MSEASLNRYLGANCSHFSFSPAALPTLQLILGMLNELKLNASLIYLHSILPRERLSQGDPSDNEKRTAFEN